MTEHSDSHRRLADDRGGRRPRAAKLSTAVVLGCLLLAVSAFDDGCCNRGQDGAIKPRTYRVGPDLADKNWPFLGDTLVFSSPAIDRLLCIRPGGVFAEPGGAPGAQEYKVLAGGEKTLVVKDSQRGYQFAMVETTAFTDCAAFFADWDQRPHAKTPDGGKTGP